MAVESAGMAGRVERGSLKIGIFTSLASGFFAFVWASPLRDCDVVRFWSGGRERGQNRKRRRLELDQNDEELNGEDKEGHYHGPQAIMRTVI
jgi:hypothetical protein